MSEKTTTIHTREKIERQYGLIKEYHEKYLKKFGVKIPALKDASGNYTKNALVLVYLSFGYPKTKEITKK